MRFGLCKSSASFVVLASLLAVPARSQNWPAFRGPNSGGLGSGVTPATWDVAKSTNVAWKTPIAGIALSSPIVWDDRIYLTTAVPSEPPRGENYRTPHVWKLMAFDRVSGKLLWDTTAYEGTPHMDRHPVSSYANSTPATDGRFVVALFGTDALACFDKSGKVLWRKVIDQSSVSPRSGHFGSSPLIVEDLAILLNDRDKDSYIAAYKLQDGAEVWRLARNEGQAQSTPALAWTNGPGGRRALLIVGGPKSLRALDPRTGKEVWGMNVDFQFSVATPAVADDVVIYGGWGKNKPVYAVRTNASGNISPSDVGRENAPIAWRTERGGPEIPSPLVSGGLVYVLASNGIVTTYGLRDGSQVYQERAGTGEYYASPVIAGDKVYIVNTDGEVTVFRAGPKMEILARNSMAESTSATPAIINGTMYMRTAGHLIALREAGARNR